MIDTPNLDTIDEVDLIDHQSEFVRKSRMFELLAEYAKVLRTAQMERKAGQVVSAKSLEQKADKIYRQLDKDFVW